MWVLMVFFWGAPASLTMHDFDNLSACQNAERIAKSAAEGHGGQVTAYCTQRDLERSLSGLHDDAPPTQ